MYTLSTLNACKGRFLHIVPDDKFIDATHAILEEVAPGAHDYLHFGVDSPLCHLRTFRPLILPEHQSYRQDLLEILPAYSGVFVHYLDRAASLLVSSAPASTSLAWLAWGADYYHLIRPKHQLWLPKTHELLDKIREHRFKTLPVAYLQSVPTILKDPLVSLQRIAMRRRLRNLMQTREDELAVLNRFRLMSTPVPEDHSALVASNPSLIVPYFDWNYWIEGFDDDTRPTRPTERNILLGNSATPENNHLDTFELIAGKLPDDCRIICPLSYGNNHYADAVERAGRIRFGERFVPLRSYMNSYLYSEIISSCSTVVMNHVRQQALGNIILSLWGGASVFLNPASPVIQAMQKIDVPVNSIDRISQHLSRNEFLCSSTVEHIRKKLREYYGRRTILHKTQTLLSQIDSSKDGRE